MAGFSQTLEAKLGATKYAQYQAIIAAHSGDVPLSVAAVQKDVFATITVKVPRTTLRDNLVNGFRTVSAAIAGPSPSDVAPAAFTPAVQINNAILLRQNAVQINNAILLRQNAALKKKLAERDAGWEIIRETLESVYSEPLNIAIAEPKESQLPGAPEVAVFHVTDVHYGKETPTYDIATCEARMLQYFNSCSEITSLRRKVAPIDEALVLLGGDMIEGEGIFPSQAWETQVDLIEQMVKGGPEYCVNLLLSIAQLYPRVRVKAGPGNHGRPSKFQSPRNNADSVFYEIVRKMVQIASPATAARIEWDLPLDRVRGAQWYSRFNIIDKWEGMLVHGDQIKGMLGFPWYGFGKKVAGWRTAKDTRGFTHIWSGHFHTHATFDLNDATVLSTGSPESSNGYALENMAAAGDPKQRLSFFNARYGLLADYAISLG